MSPRLRNLIQLVLALGILAAGVAGARYLVATAPKVARVPVQESALVVDVEMVVRSDHPLRIEARGTTRPARQATLKPQVSGTVVWVAPELVPGGLVKAGQTLVKIDRRDSELALARAQASLRQARMNLEIEEGRQRIAEKEWKLFSSGGIAPAPAGAAQSDLALRIPQLEASRAAVEAARAEAGRAALDLERTTLLAPFDAVVETRTVEVGELVGPQTPVLGLVGVEAHWVELALREEELVRLSLPGIAGTPASTGVASLDLGGREIRRPARVLQLLGTLDAEVRRPRVLVQIDDPYGLRTASTPGHLPILVGSHVQIELEGTPLTGLVAIPRRAVSEGDKILVADPEDRLRIRRVSIAWSDRERVYVETGIEAGERVIVSSVPVAIEGMRLRTARPGAAS